MNIFSIRFYQRLILLAACALTIGSSAIQSIDQSVSDLSLSHERIKQARYDLKRTDISRRSARVALVSALVAAGCYAAYTYYTDTKSEGILQLGEYPATLSWKWLKRISAIVRDSLVAGAISSGVLNSETCAELFRPISIEWYIKHRINLVTTLDELHQSVVVLDNQKTFSCAEQSYAQELCASSTRSLRIQIEHILGFIEFKKEYCQSNAQAVEALSSIAHYLTQVTEQLFADITSSPDKEQLVKRYTELLEKIIIRLSHVEQDYEFFAHEDARGSKVTHG